jgi:nucleoside-diphosphate-sugar epimerase
MAAESMINPTAIPFRFFLLGATGRTGLPFLAQALARGHFVTIFVRNVSKLPVALASHPRLRTFTGELHEADKMARAMGEANPDVVFAMLASETAPYTAVSTGTHSALQAIAAVTKSHAIHKYRRLGTRSNWGLYHRLLGAHVCRYRKDVVLVETSR